MLIAGPMLHPSEASFVNHHALPICHGMTLGELVAMISADERLGLALDVVRMQGYRRSAYFDETGLRWWPPSPNLRTVEQARVVSRRGARGRHLIVPERVINRAWEEVA